MNGLRKMTAEILIGEAVVLGYAVYCIYLVNNIMKKEKEPNKI